ncbi:MAG: hypothetical protein ACLSG9_03815 [Eubacterium sp.]
MIVGNGTKIGYPHCNDKSDGNRSRPCGRCGRCLLLYGGPVFVIDYGTATTYDLVTEDGAFVCRCDSTRYKNQCESTLEQCGETSGN